MTQSIIHDFARDGLLTLLLMCAPVMLPILIAGVFIGMIQAATSINDSVLSFLPKIVISLGCLTIFGSMILSVISDYAIRIYEYIPQITQ
jgi:flagellar biosynthetic protein FliQ